MARLWRAFSFVTKLSDPIQKKTVISQLVSSVSTACAKDFQKIHGTKMAQNGTKLLTKIGIWSRAECHLRGRL
jgi:hypothetical protein